MDQKPVGPPARVIFGCEEEVMTELSLRLFHFLFIPLGYLMNTNAIMC
jgi:hypothetical protein